MMGEDEPIHELVKKEGEWQSEVENFKYTSRLFVKLSPHYPHLFKTFCP